MARAASRTALPAPQQRACQCGSLITMVPLEADRSVLIPVDVDRDSGGSLLAVGSRDGYTVRVIRPGEERTAPAGMRRRAHWDVCPHAKLWADTKRRAGLLPSGAGRFGPCARCRITHAYHYGGPVASPLCDPCRVALNLEPLEE